MIKKLFLLSILTLAMAGCSDSGLATELITKSTEATTEELKCGNDHSDYRGLNRRCMGILGISIDVVIEEGVEEATEKSKERSKEAICAVHRIQTSKMRYF
ncbi:hypothetical protein LJD82_08225 [Enterococcus faecium]|uniref:hypothetical protein n=1 Tax=Enterococcus faecium TaxID=1352 RepID=UPI001D0A53E9|nr:hypothetical protein [Enterococcus faecium]MCB8595639.1 hypothetical protein [Enterococcus faecium]MCQ4656066.1 hypothetical protein [Enterococcus faecium]